MYPGTIKAISEFPSEPYQTISDSWDDIIESENDGTYLSKYSIGDTKYYEAYGYPMRAVIIGFNSDDLSDDTGKAKITWASKSVHPDMIKFDTRTSSTASWANSSVRNTLNDDFYNNISSDLRSIIKTVRKITKDTTTQFVTDDKIFNLSRRELGDTDFETEGPVYEYYSTAEKRKCYDYSSSGYSSYMLRTTNNRSFYVCTSSGSSSSSLMKNNSAHINICFAT